MAYYRFSTGPLPEDTRALLTEIPGAKVSATSIAMPENGAFIVEELLRDLGIGYTARPPKPRPRITAKLALPWLKSWVPEFLTPYQREGVMWALNAPSRSGHLWHPAGAGKTLESIVWALSMPGVTVAAVKASIRKQWAHEVEIYTTAPVIELEGQTPYPITIPAGMPAFLVVSYEVLPYWIDAIKALGRVENTIYDEIHSVKNWKRFDAIVQKHGDGQTVDFALKDNQAGAAYQLSRLARHRISTTRTPLADRPRDLWAQLDLIHPWEFGPFYGPKPTEDGPQIHSGFAWRYCAATEGQFGGIDTRGKSNVIELRRRIANVVHTVPYAVTHRHLPGKRRHVTYVPVRDQVRADGMANEIRAAMKGVRTGAEGRAKLREVLVMEAAARKRPMVIERTIEAVGSGQKVTIFTGRRRDCDQWGEMLQKKLPGVKVWIGHGGHSLEARRQMQIEYFGDPGDPERGLAPVEPHPGPCVLVGTADAWGTGLNLQDTDLAIMAMLPINVKEIIQREQRFARLGQRRKVLIWYPICEGTIDERLAAIFLNKLPAAEQITQFDELEGVGRELIGASEQELLDSMLDKILAEKSEEKAG